MWKSRPMSAAPQQCITDTLKKTKKVHKVRGNPKMHVSRRRLQRCARLETLPPDLWYNQLIGHTITFISLTTHVNRVNVDKNNLERIWVNSSYKENVCQKERVLWKRVWCQMIQSDDRTNEHLEINSGYPTDRTHQVQMLHQPPLPRLSIWI